MITGANGSERSTKAQKQYDSIKATTSSTSSKVAAANALAQSQGKARTEAEQKRAAASSTASTKTETSTGSDKSSSSSSKKSSKSSGSSSSSSQNQKKKELSKEEKSSILKSMLNDATVGNSRTYGLSFQSTANKQIQDSYDSRRQTLVEQATRNGYIKNEEKVAAANALAQQQGMARTQAELARKKANQVIKDQVQGVYRTLGEQARENLSGLDQAQGYRRTQNEIQRYQTAAEQVKKQKNILYDQERGMRRTSQELARQINQLEEEMANQHGRDYQFDENGKAIGVKSLKELQNQLEDLQEKKASVDNESALTRAQAALTRLDSKTRELLAQMNRGGESNSNETRMHGDTAHNATREAAKKQLLQMGYSEDQVERLAEYEQRLQDYTDAMSRMQSMQEFADKNFLTGALATAASAALSPLKAAGNIESIRGILPAALGGYKNEDMPTNIYSPWFFASQSSGALRSGVMQDMGKTGQFLYQVGTSALDSAVNMAVSTGLVGAAGGLSGAAAQNAIAKTMNFVMGSEVAADSVYQGIQEGKSNSAALIDGIVEGAIEGFTEEHSVGDILDGMLNGGTIWQKLRNAAISEGSEEVASNWLNRAYDVISRQDKSEVLKAYNGYVEAGKSPAQALAAVVGDFVGEDTVSFLAGGLSGLAMSGAYAGANKVTERFVDPTASAWDQAMLDTMQGIQTPENVTKTRQATATDNAISEAIMQGQSGITPDVATNKPKDVKNLLNATKEQITRYIQNAFNKQNQYKYLKISDVSPELAATLKTAGIDVDGYAHALRDNDLRHVDKSHGSQSNDKYKVTSEVLEQAQNIIDNYDALYRGYDTKAGNPTVVYEKRMGNRTFYVEEVLEDGLLGTKQMLITGEDSKPSFLKKMTKIASTSTDTSVPTQSGTTGQSPPGKHVQDAESSADYNQNVASTAGTVNTQNRESRNSVQGDNVAGNVSDILNNAREQYGTIPVGENPVREVSLPQSVDGERKVSRFARTAAEAQATTDEMVERIEQMVAEGRLDHEVYSNKQALSDGAKQIEHEYARGKSIEQIRSEFIQDANNGKAGAKFVSQGTTLYADAIAKGDYQAASDILVALTAVETNAGQTVQAARLMKSMTPEGRIFTVQKMVSNLERQINRRRSVNDQIELNVPAALLEAYQNATTQQAQQAALDNIYQYVADEIPATLREGLQQWRYFSMLANPSTHLKNITGNISGAIAKIGKDNLAALGETLIIGGKEGRTKAFLNPMSKADRNLLNLSWADYDNAADLFEDSTGKYSQAAGEINDRRRYWKINDPQNALTRGMDKALGVLEKASDLNGKALEVEDMWFSKPMYSVALAGYMKANHLTEITDAARTYAMTEAKRGTFNDINKVSKWATNLGQNSKIGRFLAGTVYPFKKVPANVMVRTVEYSPLGYLKGLYDLAKMKGNPDITVAQTIDDFAAATTGTALLGIGALLAKHGILRATGAGDDKEKEQQKNAFGAKDFSLLAGDNYIPIDSLTITGTGLLTGAQIWESAQNMKNGDAPIALEDVLDALSKITDPVFEQSMLSGLDSILSTLQNSADAGAGETATKIGIQILGNYIGQYVPSFVGRVASSLDKNQRSTYTEPNGVWAPIQGAVQGVQQKIPGLREQMAVRYGNWGVPVDGNGANGVGIAIFNAVTPVYPSKQKTDPVEEEIARLHDVNAEYSNFYKKPSKSIAVGREMVKLTSDQYAQYIETSGQTDYGIRAEMLESEIYKRVSDNVKSKAMSLSQEYANAIGKEAAGVGYESDDKWINELKGKSKEEIAEAILAKAISDEGYLSDDLQKQLDTVNGLYGSGAYVGTSPDLLEAAKRKAENYYRNVEKSKYGYELTDDEQALAGENQKVIAEHFLENAVADKYKDKNKDGTRMDEVLGAYRDGEISERLAMSTLEDKVVDAYADFGKEAGVTADMVLQTANAYARMKEEKDIDDVVTLSVEAQLDDWLDEQNWTAKQKEALRLGYYTNRVESYNKLVEKLDNGSITVGEAKKGLTSKYQAAWTHEISHTGVDMQDYISALATYEGAPSADERDEMGFDYKWEWYCNELNKTDLTAEQKFAIVNATDDFAERTQKKIAQAVKATYIPTDSSGTGSGGGSYSSGGSSGGGYSSGYSSGWNSDDDEQNKLERAYERFGKNVGVTESMMQQAKDAKKKMYEIVDMDGKTVRSVEDQFDAWLANQSWTAEQKEAVRAGFYTDTVRNLQWLSANLRSGNISTAEAKFELSPTLQAGWSTNVLESGASMADYIDAITVFKQAPNEDGRKAIGYKTKWEWWCDKLNETSMTPEQKYAVAISVQEYEDSTKKKIAKKLSWTGKKEDAAAKTSSIASTGDAFWDELVKHLAKYRTDAESATSTAATSGMSNDFWTELDKHLAKNQTKGVSQSIQQEQTYQIRTDTGYKEYLNLLAGRSDEYKASDGSVWTKGEDGEVYATKNGKSMRAEAVFDKADSSAQTRSSAAENAQEDGYTVNSPAGRLAYRMLENGVLTEWPATDGWTWKRTDSGIIAVKGKTRLPVLLAG